MTLKKSHSKFSAIVLKSCGASSNRINSKKSLIDNSKRNFLRFIAYTLACVGGVYVSVPFFSSWLPNAKTKRQDRSVMIDLSNLEIGAILTIEWAGKPIFILRRTPQMLRDLKLQTTCLRDPESRSDQQPNYAKNIYRARNPEYAVLVGVCTHLGCVPKHQTLPNIVDQTYKVRDGFYCPCHGSCFDNAGRVFKNMPAPLNLEVPPYYFKEPYLLVIGESR